MIFTIGFYFLSVTTFLADVNSILVIRDIVNDHDTINYNCALEMALKNITKGLKSVQIIEVTHGITANDVFKLFLENVNCFGTNVIVIML